MMQIIHIIVYTLKYTIIMTVEEQHEDRRKLCWLHAAATIGSAESCRSTDTAIHWANTILQKFDEKFPAPTSKKTSTNQES